MAAIQRSDSKKQAGVKKTRSQLSAKDIKIWEDSGLTRNLARSGGLATKLKLFDLAVEFGTWVLLVSLVGSRALARIGSNPI